MRVRVFTIGHGTRPAEELTDMLRTAGVEMLVDVRRFPGSRRNPHFNQAALAEPPRGLGTTFRHGGELGAGGSTKPAGDGSPSIASATFPTSPPGRGRVPRE